MVTSSEHTQVYAHVMGLIGDPSEGSGEIAKTLKVNGILNILDICNLNKHMVEQLYYKVSNRKIELTIEQQSLVINIGLFMRHKRKNDASFGILNWLNVTQDDFDEFRLGYRLSDYLPATPEATNICHDHAIYDTADFAYNIDYDPNDHSPTASVPLSNSCSFNTESTVDQNNSNEVYIEYNENGFITNTFTTNSETTPLDECSEFDEYSVTTSLHDYNEFDKYCPQYDKHKHLSSINEHVEIDQLIGQFENEYQFLNAHLDILCSGSLNASVCPTSKKVIPIVKSLSILPQSITDDSSLLPDLNVT